MNLFMPIVAEEKMHPNFMGFLASHSYEPVKQVIEALANSFADRDGKFVKEYQTTFNPSFWELYLFASLHELGFSWGRE